MVIEAKNAQQFDVMGGIVRYLASPEDTPGGDHCIMEGELPAGVVIPLHTHPDPESFYLLDGQMELYLDDGVASGWQTVRAGELAVVPGSAKHAWRNTGGAASHAIIITGPHVYGFFRSIGRPVDANRSLGQPDANRMAEVLEAAKHNQCWNAGPEENEAIGISMPMLK